MLQPTRTKFRKAHKGRIHGKASRCNFMNYGAYGLKAMAPDRVISKQIEAARGATWCACARSTATVRAGDA